MLKKVMMLAALMALALVVAAPSVLAQDVKSEALPGGKASAQSGDEVKSKADPECADAGAGGTASKACSKPEEKKVPPPPPPPKAAAPAPAPAPPPPPKALPPSGGAGIASLLGLGAGALLVGGGLVFGRLVR